MIFFQDVRDDDLGGKARDGSFRAGVVRRWRARGAVSIRGHRTRGRGTRGGLHPRASSLLRGRKRRALVSWV